MRKMLYMIFWTENVAHQRALSFLLLCIVEKWKLYFNNHSFYIIEQIKYIFWVYLCSSFLNSNLITIQYI